MIIETIFLKTTHGNYFGIFICFWDKILSYKRLHLHGLEPTLTFVVEKCTRGNLGKMTLSSKYPSYTTLMVFLLYSQSLEIGGLFSAL